MLDIFEKLIGEISSRGYGESELLFSDSELNVLLNELSQLILEGEVRSAKIGSLNVEREVTSIRKDDIYWLQPEAPSPSTAHFFEVMQALSTHLSSTCFVSLNRMEFHFARYSPGAFYRRHLDRFRGGNSRKFSVILYLNPQWNPKDGGELALYLNDETVYITPTWGKLVMFASDAIEHEVLVTHKERYSLTGWLRYDDLTLSQDLSTHQSH